MEHTEHGNGSRKENDTTWHNKNKTHTHAQPTEGNNELIDSFEIQYTSTRRAPRDAGTKINMKSITEAQSVK